MNRLCRRNRLLTILCLCATSLAASVAARGDTTALLVHGSPDAYWIARVEQEQASPAYTRIRERQRDTNVWRQIAQVSAPAVSLSSRGSQLIVLFDSGDWMWIWDGGSATGALPQDGAKLIQIAADPIVGTTAGANPRPVDQNLWAIGSSGEGRAASATTTASTAPASTLPSTAPSTAQSTTAPASTTSASTAPSSGPTTAAAANGLPFHTRILYRMSGGTWVRRGLVPASVQDSELSLAVIGDEPMLAAISRDGTILTFTWDDKAVEWKPAGTLHPAAKPARIKLLSGLGRAVLWAGDAYGVGAIYPRGQDWSAPIALPLPSDAPHSEIFAVGVAMDAIRLDILNDKGRIIEYSYNHTGAPVGHAQLVEPVGPNDQTTGSWFSALAAALLMLVLLNSLRRRGAVPAEKVETTALNLAPNGLRLLAATIDALPVICTILIVSMGLDPLDMQNVDRFVEAMQFPFYIAVGVYVLHTMITELIWGWSIGKRICGLHVVMLDGSPPTKRAIVVRNLLRIIDAAMVFPPLLVLISPLRQRVGDVAAETIVVTDEPVAKDETPQE